MESLKSKNGARTEDLGRGLRAIIVCSHNDRTQTPPATRSTLTVLTNASAKDPMSATIARVRRREIIQQIGTARIHHSSMLEQFILESQPDATAFAALTRPALHRRSRWIGIHPTYRLEKELSADFFSLLGKMVDIWTKEPRRNIDKINNLIDTHRTLLLDDRHPGHTLRPDLFVQGTSSLFPPHHIGDKLEWSSCVAIGDVKLHQGRKKMDTFGQLGTYAEQVFSAQENRRFIPTFYFDNSHIVWCIFDRGGAVHGDAVNYQRDPRKLCALVLYFLFNGTDLGMDTSIRYEDGLTLISTTPPPEVSSATSEETFPKIPRATFVVQRTLFHSTDIQGSGTIYWFVQRHDPRSEDEGNWCIIKDTWVVNGCKPEREIYERIHSSLTQAMGQDGPREGITPSGQGVAPLLFTHDVLFAGRLDSVSINRPPGVNTLPEDNRVHTRAVFRATAGVKLLDQFSSAMELLVAVRDAVQGHRRLQSHGVLHTNITPYRILIQPDAQEGDRGVLLDYASDSIDFPSPRTGATGSHAFSSRGVERALIKGIPFTHSYFDDLESFFYVLCYLVVCHPTSGSRKPKTIPRSVSAWFDEELGWQAKSTMMLEHTFPLPIDDSFQPPVSELMIGLHHFFHKYTEKSMGSQFNWCPEPEEGYGVFLDHLNNAIDGLRVGELVMDPGTESTMPNHEVAMPRIRGGVGDKRTFHCRNSEERDYHDGESTSADGRLVSQHPSFMSHGDEGRPSKQTRTPSPRPSKRMKAEKH